MKSMSNFNHAHGKCIVFTERGFYRIKKKLLGLMYFFFCILYDCMLRILFYSAIKKCRHCDHK